MGIIELSILDIIRRKGATALPKVLQRHCETLAASGYLARSDSRWRLTDAGWLELRFQESLADNRALAAAERLRSTRPGQCAA